MSEASKSGPPHEAPTIRVSAMPADTNCYGDIFGGWLVGQMDLAAGSLASLECNGRAVTVAIDAIGFHHPVHVGDEVSFYARLDRLGRSSIRIAVEAWRRERNCHETCKVTEAIFTFVAIDDTGRSRPVRAVCSAEQKQSS